MGGTFWHWPRYKEALGESRVAFACLTLVLAWLVENIYSFIAAAAILC